MRGFYAARRETVALGSGSKNPGSRFGRSKGRGFLVAGCSLSGSGHLNKKYETSNKKH